MDEILQTLLQYQNPNRADVGEIPRPPKPTTQNVKNFVGGIPTAFTGLPVDLANEVLRPFGLGSETPVGGSRWQQELLGVDPDAIETLAGAFISPDPTDFLKAMPLLAARKGFGMADNVASELENIVAKNKVRSDYEKDVSFTTTHEIDTSAAGRQKNKKGYRGAPRGVTSPQALGRMRSKVWDLLETGAPGRNWYDRSTAAIKELTGDRENYTNLAAGANAITSRGASVKGNQKFGAKGHNQAVTGRPGDTGRFPSTQGPAIDDLASGRGYVGGPKETPFYEGLTLDQRAAGVRPTNDIWMARSFGFVNPDGTDFSSGLSLAQHRFIDNEIKLLTQKANEAKIGGFDDWTPERIQAALWVGKKSVDQKIPVTRAAEDFASNLDDLTTTIRYEARPSESLDHLRGISSSPEYADVIHAVLNNNKGQDVLALESGALTRAGDQGWGPYEGAVSPSMSTQILGGNTAKTSNIDDATWDLARAIGATHGLNLGQDSAGITANLAAKGPDRNIARFDLGETPNQSEMLMIEDALLKRFGGSAIPLHAPGGVDVASFVEGGGNEFAKAMRDFGGGMKPKMGHNSGNLIGNADFDNPAFTPGYKPSEWMRELDEAFAGAPAFEKRVEKGAQLEAKTLMEVDDFLQQNVADAGVADKLLTLTRQILVKDGFAGIRKAVQDGILPAAVLGIVAKGMTQEDTGNGI